MICKRHFVSKLRELKYDFKEQLHFQDRYRKRGGTHIIHVPRCDNLEDDWVRFTLRQAGLQREEIENFVRECHKK